MSAPVWLVIGAQAAGKSTTADLLARRIDADRAVHLRGGQFYRWAVTGWVHAGDPDRPAEARRLLELRYRLAASSADEYCRAGFTTVVQDNIYGDDVMAWLDRVEARPRHLVVLRPRIDVVEAREEHRNRTTGKVAYRPGSNTAADLDAQLARTPGVGLWLDNSDQTPDETVDEILRRRAEAVVDGTTGLVSEVVGTWR